VLAAIRVGLKGERRMTRWKRTIRKTEDLDSAPNDEKLKDDDCE
jgi:hypothetical protein